MANEPKSKRQELRELLLTTSGVKAVYYIQPPSKDMVFPCIVYALERVYSDLANNNRYGIRKKYEVTHITKNPLEDIEDELLALPYTSFENKFISDNMVHTKIGIYF